ncbi:dipeptidase [Helicovermis profundi]|uniref:Membrane dipeptidase n=1 Tax=Helicovermis profundi TaxID=3065157 RepID=A0AAU9E237_9FIRM|nr:membrane dipeptidase [Clostridia bacterium S502]
MFKKAKKILKDSVVIDAHLDLGGIVYNNRILGKTKILNELFLSDFREASVNFIIAAIFVETPFLDSALKMALLQIEHLKADIKECKDFVLVKNSFEMEEALKENKIGIIMSLEGLEPIGRNIELLNTFYELGIRGFGVTWSRRNFVADGSYFASPREGVLGGLTPFGIEVMKKAEELGLFIDISHINDIGFKDVFKYTTSAIIASHSNSRKLNNITRNLNDEQIIKIANRNGVIGVNAYKSIVSSNELKQNIIGLCDHIDYIVNLTSDENIGFGFDLCTKYYNTGKMYDSLRDHKEIIGLTIELLNRGYSEKSIKNIIGNNFYSYLLEKLR